MCTQSNRAHKPMAVLEIIESLRLEKTSKIIKSNRQLITTLLTKPCLNMPYLHVF